ncbi:MAG: hypothetical protein CME70_16500 [Halobacteriovorax sp.]|nr:hypothetical protein [Halobacteriovorax sp.]|tara:strand:- start:43769 stop:44584 length:816 start_codon:yes stop_codon:yes gene_type:complete
MAELLIITRNQETYSHQRLLRAAGNLSLKVEVLQSNQFVGLPEEPEHRLVLHRDSGISFDDIDLIVSKHLENKGLKVINSTSTTELLRGKDKQFLFFKNFNLPHIPTFLCRGKLKPKELPPYDEFVVKTIRGNQGIGVMLLKDSESLLSLLDSNHARKDERYIIQPRLNFSSEYRVLLLNNEVLGVIEKKLTSDFRANAKRCETRKTLLPKEFEPLIQRINELLPEQFLGVDIGIFNGEPVIIEINTTPGFEEFDKLHNFDTAQALIERNL